MNIVNLLQTSTKLLPNINNGLLFDSTTKQQLCYLAQPK